MSEAMSINEQKMIKAQAILALGKKPKSINEVTYSVPSQRGNWLYTVTNNSESWVCECADYRKRNSDCKHISTVKIWNEMEESLKEPESKPLSYSDCPECGSFEVVKNGTRKTKNGRKIRFLCKECNHSFSLRENGFENMKFDSEIVGEALNLYFSGVSFRKISQYLTQKGIEIRHTTIYYWIKKYSKIVSEYVDTITPTLSDTWCVDEMMVKVKEGGIKHVKRGKTNYVWLWNCMDEKTRFLLANQTTKLRGIKDVQKLFYNAKKVSQLIPDYIITDGLPAYPKGIRKTFGWRKEPIHMTGQGLTDWDVNNNLVERLHGTIRQREKIMRAMQNGNTSEELLQGYRVHYNFIRPHMALDGLTPAEKAGINLNLGNNKWKALIELATSSSNVTLVDKSTLNGLV